MTLLDWLGILALVLALLLLVALLSYIGELLGGWFGRRGAPVTWVEGAKSVQLLPPPAPITGDPEEILPPHALLLPFDPERHGTERNPN